MKVEVVAVDVGGVLFSDGSGELLRRAPELTEILRGPCARQLKCGQIGSAAFWRWACERMPRGWDVARVRSAWFAAYHPVRAIHELVAALRIPCPRPRIVAFSGNFAERVTWLEHRFPFRHLFDSEVWSHEVGHTKPSPEFVDALIAHVAVQPSQIVYLDDKPSAFAPARERGMLCLHVQAGASVEPLRQQLRGWGVVC